MLKDLWGDLDELKVAGIFVALSIALIALYYFPASPDWGQSFTPEHFAYFNLQDSSAQRFAFKLYLIVLFTWGLLPVIRYFGVELSPSFHTLLRSLIGFTLLSWGASCLYFLNTTFWVWGLALGILFVVIIKYMPQRWFYIISFLMLLLPIIIGFLAIPMPVTNNLSMIDAHYAVVLSQGERLADGMALYHDNIPYYGILMPSLLATIYEIWQPLSLHGLLRWVQSWQVIMSLLFMTLAWRLSQSLTLRWRHFHTMSSLLLVGMWLSSIDQAIWFPNQSGLRFWTIPLGLWVVCCSLGVRPLVASMLIGGMSGIAMLNNLETGIMLTAGMGMAWLLRLKQTGYQQFGLTLLAGLGSLTLVILIFLVLYQALFNHWPVTNLSHFFSIFSSGYGGIIWSYDPLSILILAHASYVFILAIGSLLSKKPRPIDIPSAAIATAILVWFPYYVNRSADWNLWLYVLLYSLLLISFLSSRAGKIAYIFILFFLLIPFSMVRLPALLHDIKWQMNWFDEPVCADTWVLERESCDNLKQRVQGFEALEGKRVLWLSGFSTLTWKMTFKASQLHVMDAFAETPTNQDWSVLLDRIQKINPEIILIDTLNNSALAIPSSRQQFYLRVIKSLPQRYEETGFYYNWLRFDGVHTKLMLPP